MTESNSGSNDVTITHNNNTLKKKWEDMINQSVHTADDIDINDIDALSRDFIVVKRGYLNEHYYYIPITKECSAFTTHLMYICTVKIFDKKRKI